MVQKGRNSIYIAIFRVKNIDIGFIDGMGQTTLRSRSNLAHYPKKSPTRVSSEVQAWSPSVDSVAFWSEKAFWAGGSWWLQITTYVEPNITHPLALKRRQWASNYSASHWADRQNNGTGIQPAKKTQRGFLGIPLLCNSHWIWKHLVWCLVYIDTNMVRAGVVVAPST